MSNIKRELDRLKEFIQKAEFLEGKGLSNEVNIWIFCYRSEDEMAVKHFLEQTVPDPNLGCNLIEHDLYRVFLSCCEDIDILDAIPDMEEVEGSGYLLEQLHSAIRESEFIEKMQYSPHRDGDVLLLTGVGEVFPFMRVHKLLEALQPSFPNVPILVMYPGEFDGHHLKLFDRLKPNDYYRAFRVI